VDAKAPVSFFAYPGKKSYLVPDTCRVHTLAALDQDALIGLDKLGEVLGAQNAQPALQAPCALIALAASSPPRKCAKP